MAKKKQNSNTMPVCKCEYCGRSFKNEDSILTHVCEKKKRILSKDDPGVQIGFKLYCRFYQTQMRTKPTPTFRDFAMSRYYNAFKAYGEFLLANDVPFREKHMQYVLRHKIPQKNWTSKQVLNDYLRGIVNSMALPDAIERSITEAVAWAQQNDLPWVDYFRKAHPNIIMNAIRACKIHPWFIYASPSSSCMFDAMTDEQIDILSLVVDHKFWKAKILMNKADFNSIKRTLMEAGL